MRMRDQENTPNDLPRCKNGIQAKEGIEPEVKIGRKANPVTYRLPEKKWRKEKGKGLTYFLHTAALNILSCSISIFPKPADER